MNFHAVDINRHPSTFKYLVNAMTQNLYAFLHVATPVLACRMGHTREAMYAFVYFVYFV